MNNKNKINSFMNDLQPCMSQKRIPFLHKKMIEVKLKYLNIQAQAVFQTIKS